MRQNARPRNLVIIRTEDRGESLHSPLPNTLLSSVAAALQDYQDSFTFLDRKGQGWVSKVELQMVLHRHEQVFGTQDFEQLWSKYQNGQGFNYLALLQDASVRLPEETLTELHKLRVQLKQASTSSPSALFMQFDENRNGRVSTEEIIKYFEGKGVNINYSTMNRLVSCYTADTRGLSFAQFVSLLLPSEVGSEPLGLELSVLLLPRQNELKSLFQSFDRIRTGRLSQDEFFRALSENVTFSEDEIKNLFQLFGNDGHVNYKEIWHRIGELRELSESQVAAAEHFADEYFDDTEKLVKKLKRADGDKDGKITLDEFTSVLEKSGINIKSRIQEIFTLLDTLKVGMVSIPELEVYLQSSLWESS